MVVRLRTLVLLAAAGGLAAWLVAWLGLYDISATDQHTRPVYQLLEYAMRRSVKARADIHPPPADLDAGTRVVAGARHYRDQCVQCHGGPGVAPDPLAFGLTPAPANLLPAARDWSPSELFWVIRNGIKSTGMPAWANQRDDRAIWDLVAFVRAMPRLTVSEYQQLAPPLRVAAEPAAVEAAAGPGDAAAGRQAVSRYLCATCHVIPGVTGANQHVGPTLGGMARRGTVAGVLPHTPENLVRFLKNPQAVDPQSAMPALGLSDRDARDIAAFLATLDKVPVK